MPCSCFGKKDKKGVDGVAEEKYRSRDSKSREREAPPPPAPAPATPPPASVTPTQGGDARLRPEDDPDKANRRRDVVASFYSDQCELIGFKATGSRPPSTHVGTHAQDAPAATSSPAASSSPGSTRSGASCRADLAEKRREFFKELAAEDNDDSSRPTSRMTDPGSQTTPRNSHYQEHHHYSLPHQSKTAPRPFKYSLPFASGRQSNPTAATVSEETQPLLEPSDDEKAPDRIRGQVTPKQATDHQDLLGKPSPTESSELLEPPRDLGSSPPDLLQNQGDPPQALPELSTESEPLIDLSVVQESPQKNAQHASFGEVRSETVESFNAPEQRVSDAVPEKSAEIRLKTSSESSETGVELVTESSETGIITESSKAGVELVTEIPKAGVELVTEYSETGVELVTETPETGVLILTQASETGVVAVPEKEEEVAYARSVEEEDSAIHEGSQAIIASSVTASESLEPIADLPAPERAQLRVQELETCVQSDDERAEEGSSSRVLINEAFSVVLEGNGQVSNHCETSPERDPSRRISNGLEDDYSPRPPSGGRDRAISLTYEDEVHHPAGAADLPAGQTGSEEGRSSPVHELEEPVMNNHSEPPPHHPLPPNVDARFLASAEEPEELLTEQPLLHQSVSQPAEEPAASREWSPRRSEEEVKTTVEIVECIPKAPPNVESKPPADPPQDASVRTPPQPTTRHDEEDDDDPLPPAPPTPPVDDEPLPLPPPTPPAEDKPLPPAPPTPPADDEPLPPAPPTPPISSEPRLAPATCSMDHASSPVLEDDGLGSEIDDALSSLECLSEEGNNSKERATAASSS